MLNRVNALALLLVALSLGSSASAQATFDVNGKNYRIDRFPSGTGTVKRPTVVLVHGIDGMAGQSAKQIEDFATQLERSGFLVFVPHYFDSHDGSASTPLPDLVKLRLGKLKEYQPRISGAIDYALKQSDADADRLGLIGFSLGAGPVLQYAESQPAGTVKAVVDFFGYLPDQQLFSDAGNLPPTLVLHNKDDKFVPVEMSEKLVKALAATPVKHDSKIYNNGDPERGFHPFTPGGDADQDARKRAVEWLTKHLK